MRSGRAVLINSVSIQINHARDIFWFLIVSTRCAYYMLFPAECQVKDLRQHVVYIGMHERIGTDCSSIRYILCIGSPVISWRSAGNRREDQDPCGLDTCQLAQKSTGSRVSRF